MNSKNDIIISTFIGANIKALVHVPIITVYKHPKDYPNKYVARLWDVHNKPTKCVVLADTIEAIREEIPKNMSCLPPTAADDPVIVEIYL